MSGTTLGDALEARLRQFGVMRVYGAPLGGLTHIAVESPDLAVLLADVDGRIGHSDGSGRLGAALLDGPILHLSSKPGGTAVLQQVRTPEELFDALAEPVGMVVPGTMSLHLDLDLEQPFDQAIAQRQPHQVPVVTLDPSMSSLRIVLLVGPGVVRASAVEDLRELARRCGWGVINTWGARGVERWDSPFNFATVGLQDLDLDYSGLVGADVVITCGLDPVEMPADALASKLVQDVPPRQLAALTSHWPVSRNLPERAPHHERAAAVLTPLYESDAVPLSGPRAALHLSGALPEGGIVVADPGPSGFWLARAFPTSTPESLCVPATYTPGFAAAAAFVCAVEGRPVIAVTDQGDLDDDLDTMTAQVLEVAESLDKSLALQLWGPLGQLSGSTAHVELSRAGLEAEGVVLSDVPVRTTEMSEIVDVLGETVAWSD